MAKKNFLILLLSFLVLACANTWAVENRPELVSNPDSLHFPVKQDSQSPLYLQDPSNITTVVEYDAENNEYIEIKKAGDVVLQTRKLSFEEYQKYDLDRMIDNYWKNKSGSAVLTQNDESLSSLIPKIKINSEWMDKIFGGQEIDIRLSGGADLKFAMVNNKNENLSLNENARSVSRFDFDETLQFNVMAQIGSAISFNLNYDNGATFDFEKELLKLKYEGKEDDILQALEAGNVSFALPTTLIGGVQNLFGVKSKLKFGNLVLDLVASQQKSESQNITIQNGAQMQEFNFKADEYDENKHFFVGRYFYDRYNTAMSTFPIINSNIVITRIEVWKTNIGSAVNNNRNIVAFADLGEKNPNVTTPNITNPYGSDYPDNRLSNDLFNVVDPSSLRNINTVGNLLQGMGFVSGQDYEKIESARRLSDNEFTFNPQLGFISLNQALSADQVLAVAYQYQIVGDSTVYQVGEFSDEGITDPNTLVVKLLKSSSLNVRNPLWKLMMKNVYWIGSSQLSEEDFRLNIMYLGDEEGIETGYFKDGPFASVPLIQVFGLDRMDSRQNMYPDGVFDFVDIASNGAGLVNSAKGLIYFPYVEPFGKDLRDLLNDDEYADKYCFDSLYTLTKSQAQQYTEKNKYYLEGRYRYSSSGGEISLGAVNVPQGSVVVMAGGIQLQEGTDYTVDYAMGRVKIINTAYLTSGTPITVSTESNSAFSMNTKWMFGIRGDYTVSPELSLGATIMHLKESPITQKVNYGEEPISNTVMGMDFHLTKQMSFITKIMDWLPFYSTNTPSTMSLEGEIATFIPGNPSVIGSSGTAYIDDFETSKRSYDLRAINSWFLASAPQDFNTPGSNFPETFKNSGLAYGFNRAKIAWYSIDDNFYNGAAPSNISNNDRSQPYAREILESEVYPNKELVQGQRNNIHEFNIAFYPMERGPYNYDTLSPWSRGLSQDGLLNDPETRWGGIMRKLEATDFEAANIESIDFWLMDPFIDNPDAQGGKLYFNLGDISEDILRDGRKSYENGLPTSAVVENVDSTIWGRVPKLQVVVNAFSNDDNARQYQDIGYDGLNSLDEQNFFTNFLLKYQGNVTDEAYQDLVKDPSADDFMYFRSSEYDRSNTKITDRYKRYNNPEGNSSVTTTGESQQATALPNVEDINQDNTLSEAENYYEYEIELDPAHMNVGENYIDDIQEAHSVSLANGNTTNCKWYHFKIPVREPNRKIGTIEGYQSIRFMRTYLRGFYEPVILRFASFELVSGEWRKYNDNLLSLGDITTGTQSDNTTLTIGTVNIEENGKRQPVGYCLPPGIEREKQYSSTSYVKQNEQSLSMKVTNLADGDARAIYKTMNYDMRQYNKLRMFVHGEKVNDIDDYQTGELTAFVRLGTDFTSNYYEYEMPISFTPWYTSMLENKAVWPEENNMVIDLDSIVKVKEDRNSLIRSGNSDYTTAIPYVEYVNGRKITVLGSPNIANVKVLMIGVRNPKKQSVNDGDDMLPKSVEVWFNEMRLTDFDRSKGWAARGTFRTNLADLGDVALSGSYKSAGFGTLEQKISTISQDNVSTLDFATNLELGKFFPDRFGIRLPFHYDYSKTVSNPRYNLLDPDVFLKDDLLSYRSERERDSIRHMVQDYTAISNFSFMNVRKERVGSNRRHFYDIENFNLSYSYMRNYSRNVDVEYDQRTQNRLMIGYQYDIQNKGWKPFGKVPLFKNKNFAIIRDITINFKPKNVSFKSDMLRDFQESRLRSKSQGLVIMEPTFYQNFYWNREYGLKWDFTTNIRMDYSATMNALIEEPRGRIDTRAKRDSVWQSIKDLGKAQQFHQQLQFNFTIPINKIPLFNWVRLTAAYQAQYTFQASTNATQSLGNTVENNRRINYNLNANLASLYSKIPLVKKAYEVRDKDKNKPFVPKKPNEKEKKDGDKNLKSDSTADSTKSQWLKDLAYFSLRLVTSVKSFNLSYSVNEGIYIPGFMPRAKYLGMMPSNEWAPGFGFVFGSQRNIMPDAIRKGWLSKDTMFNAAYVTKMNKTLNAQVKIEPFKDFNIDLTFKKTESERYSAYYKYNAEQDRINGPMTPYTNGSYSISFFALGTMFKGMDKDNVSETFETFLSNRDVIAERLAEQNRRSNPEYGGEPVLDTTNGRYYPDGYGATSQQVLIPAFLAAYSGKDAGKQSLSPFLKMPMPNWRITYTGLSKKDWVKNWASSITVSSNYTCNYNVSSFYTNSAVPDNPAYDYGTEWIRNSLNNNFVPKQTIDQILINEQLSPLIKIDVNLKNSLQFNFEIKKERSLSLSFTNTQLTEVNRFGFIIGTGYRFKDVAINIRTGGQNVKQFKSDILVKADFSFTSNKTVLRKIDQEVNIVSAGSKVSTLNLSGEYSLTEKIILKAFFDITINTPYISSSYPNSTTEGGFVLKIVF